MRAIAYKRVSSEEQAESGAGLKAQQDACTRYAEREGWDIFATYEDLGLSGGLPPEKRPGLLAALGALRKGDVLLVAKRDRVARDMMVAVMIESAVRKVGARLVSAAGEGSDGDERDPAVFMQRRLADLFAEYEKLLIRSRTRMAMAAMRRRGERIGHVPYGFDLTGDGKHLIANPNEQNIISTLQVMRAGGRTYRYLAGWLNDHEVPTKRGKGKWRHTAVVAILKRGDHAEA